MKPHFNVSFRHGGRNGIDTVYACDINRYAWKQVGRYGYFESVRIATVPMHADTRTDHQTPSYAGKLLAWHQRRASS